ncbi:hypothetical protein GWI33_005655 [Rhynchophorus ferrugineus]|uniref:Leucine-rich repeat-containing protein DDB_G0290503 n=1 Tax=Rhynchophorus ferrugineus TaxID=354439 RepID=A0A834IYS8_RHYFE|nr:hypothetical protein GWI33_005655 [Rhynchophorus ferrugineus]
MTANKACIKKDLKHLQNDIDDLIMLEDSARGTLCAIHKTIHSVDNFPCSRHKMLKLCPIPRNNIPCSTRIPRLKRKIRSSSPCTDHQKMCRTMSANNPCMSAPIPNCRIHDCNPCHPETNHINYYNLEKTISCPGQMYHISKMRENGHFTSTSSIQTEKLNRCTFNTDDVVNELKSEIEKVKEQLRSISKQRAAERNNMNCASPPSYTTRILSDESEENKLKNENKRLKRELEAKKKLLEKSKGDVDKAKDILNDYEQKVTLLHAQAVKSSKAMKLSKEKFCQCLKDRDDKMKKINEENEILSTKIMAMEKDLNNKCLEMTNLKNILEGHQRALSETCDKCSALNDANQSYCESIEFLKLQLINSNKELETHKETVKSLEQKLSNLNGACKKMNSKTKKRRENFKSQLKNYDEEKNKMAEKISQLSARLKDVDEQKQTIKELKIEREELENKLKDYETITVRCQRLEDECKKHCETLLTTQSSFQSEREEMHKLIDELTTVVKENKVTILHMSQINKEQENLIKSQSIALMSKEEQIKVIEKQSEQFESQNIELQKELEKLKKHVSEPCSRAACLCISKELEHIKSVLTAEKDTKLLKEKIIEDQSQTILNLQKQVKDKMTELNKAQVDTKYLEEEINRINEKLILKHKELDKEIDEKENLIEKLRVLECQRNQLTEEIGDFEDMLQEFKENCGTNENQQQILQNLEKQIDEQRKEWDFQKQIMVKEKQQAICAAKFATQKLLDTVVDFQRQVDAQKKVQVLLTKMLHDKDEQLKRVTSKIANINNITQDVSITDLPMKQIFFRKAQTSAVPSNVNTNTSVYSSCSSCCKKNEFLTPKYDKNKINNEDKICIEVCYEMNQILDSLSRNSTNIKQDYISTFNSL